MDISSVTLTVFYEGQFYVGLVERTQNDKLSVARIVFGAEPKDYEVLSYVLENYHRLAFSPQVAADAPEKRSANPKRLQRVIARQVNSVGVGTKSQQALALLREENKLERRVISRAQREAEKEAQFLLRQEKRKEKHRGH